MIMIQMMSVECLVQFLYFIVRCHDNQRRMFAYSDHMSLQRASNHENFPQ